MAALWAEHRRAILITLLSLALVAFFQILAPETRASLLRGLFANRVLVALLLIFNLLVLSLLFSAGQRLDMWIFVLLNQRGHHPRWLDFFMVGFTQIGNGVVGLLLGAFLYFSGLRSLAVQLLAGILSLWLMVELVKALVERRRPYLLRSDARIIGWRERGLSFPSGHTAQTFFMATVLAEYLHVGALLAGLIYGAAVLVGFTRVYVGAHYPRDVAAGAMLGSVWGIVVSLLEVYFIN